LRDFVVVVSQTERWLVSAPTEVVRRLTEALNERDRDGFLGLLADDVEFRTPMGTARHGLAAAKEFWRANEAQGVFVEQDGAERVDGARVAVPNIVRMADGTELRSARVFEIRDDKVVVFCVGMNRADAGL
jgi:ketosteroid isomerase-like protein